MSMEINNTYGNYATVTNDSKTSKKESVASEAKQYNATEYAEVLSKKYDCVKNGNVAISGSYLRQCANDPEKAKELEENLSLYKEIYDHAYKSAQKAAASNGGTVTSYSMTWNVDSEGNISMIGMTTVRTETGTKKGNGIWEDLNKRVKEKKEEAKKTEKKAAEKREKQKQLEKLREKRNEKDENTHTYEIRIVGKEVSSMSEKMIEAMSQITTSKTAMSGTVGFDIKA